MSNLVTSSSLIYLSFSGVPPWSVPSLQEIESGGRRLPSTQSLRSVTERLVLTSWFRIEFWPVRLNTLSYIVITKLITQKPTKQCLVL